MELTIQSYKDLNLNIPYQENSKKVLKINGEWVQVWTRIEEASALHRYVYTIAAMALLIFTAFTALLFQKCIKFCDNAFSGIIEKKYYIDLKTLPAQEIIKIVKQNGLLLEHVLDELKDERNVVLAAVKANGMALKYASDNMKRDKSIIEQAINNCADAAQYALQEPISNFIENGDTIQVNVEDEQQQIEPPLNSFESDAIESVEKNLPVVKKKLEPDQYLPSTTPFDFQITDINRDDVAPVFETDKNLGLRSPQIKKNEFIIVFKVYDSTTSLRKFSIEIDEIKNGSMNVTSLIEELMKEFFDEKISLPLLEVEIYSFMKACSTSKKWKEIEEEIMDYSTGIIYDSDEDESEKPAEEQTFIKTIKMTKFTINKPVSLVVSPQGQSYVIAADK